MNITKKIIVSDYDRTFYINDKDIEKNKIAVAEFEKKGNMFIIATGRSYFDFKNKTNTYNINYNYVILNHGATIINGNDEVIYNFPINNDIIPKIKNELNLEKTIEHFCCSKLESRVDFNHPNLTKIRVKYNDKEKTMRINKILNEKFSEYINSYYVSNNAIEIISNKTNKSNAIKSLIQKLNINERDVYTIGDGFTDIKMVKDFNGYCMVESIEELKKIAIKQYNSVSELIKDVMSKITIEKL